MRVLVNGLSVTNLSGRHVLLGHLRQIAKWAAGEHDFVVLHHAANADMRCDMGPHVDWIECPRRTAHWLGRSMWERFSLPGVVRRFRADLLFTSSGVAAPFVPAPQVVFAQNPWCLVNGLERTAPQRAKALLQRHAYKRAMAAADLMVFNSGYMREAYRQNAGFHEHDSEVVYQAIDEDTHDAAERLRSGATRNHNQIVCVSVMTPHKDIETLVKAVQMTRARHEFPAELSLVGPWADARYERRVRALVHALGLDSAVEFTGRVPREDLHRRYSEARVFCLMSRCESFGIPAIEAQAFGTPVVSSNCCAIPEVCGEGGVYPDVGDVGAVADALARLLSDEGAWQILSERAVTNAAKYRWHICSSPLTRMFELAVGSGARN